MTPSIPGLNFRLFGFPVTIGLDFLLITLLLGLGARPAEYLVEWFVVVTVSILLHELGHAFALRHFGTHPSIRLWGLGGLTVSGFALPPRRSILVSLAGPLLGLGVGLVAAVLQPWLPGQPMVAQTAADLVFVNVGWAILNLLPIAGLDGGNVLECLFLLGLGSRGRAPGLIVVAVCSLAIAIGAALIGFLYLAIVVLLFGMLNPTPYLELWHRIQPGGARVDLPRASWIGGGEGAGRRPVPVATEPERPADRRRERDRNRDRERDLDRRTAVAQAVDVRRHFAEVYAEALPDGAADPDELESRPEPLLADVSGMLAPARHDDGGVALRLATEPDPLAVLGIVARIIDARRVKPIAVALRRQDPPVRETGLLKLQVGLHALSRFEEAIETGQELAQAHGENVRSAVLLARSAARQGDRRLTATALARAIELGLAELSEASLADLARLGPDGRVAELLARLRRMPAR